MNSSYKKYKHVNIEEDKNELNVIKKDQQYITFFEDFYSFCFFACYINEDERNMMNIVNYIEKKELKFENNDL